MLVTSAVKRILASVGVIYSIGLIMNACTPSTDFDTPRNVSASSQSGSSFGNTVTIGTTTGTMTTNSSNGTTTIGGTSATVTASAPTITSFTPTSATGGTMVIILGTGFRGTTSVSFGGVAATSFTVVSDAQINAIVSPNGASGNVVVITSNGTATRAGFTISSPPVALAFSPTSGKSGTQVTILGANFIGTTIVRFGGVPAAGFTVISATQIEALVGSGASGDITVSTPGGIVTLPGFTFLP